MTDGTSQLWPQETLEALMWPGVTSPFLYCPQQLNRAPVLGSDIDLWVPLKLRNFHMWVGCSRSMDTKVYPLSTQLILLRGRGLASRFYRKYREKPQTFHLSYSSSTVSKGKGGNGWNFQILQFFRLGQGSSTSGPRAACGPPVCFVRPGKAISQNTKRYEYWSLSHYTLHEYRR